MVVGIDDGTKSMTQNWLEEVGLSGNDWSRNYIYNAWVQAAKNHELRHILEPIAVDKSRDLFQYFNRTKPSLIKEDFLRKMKNAWNSKRNRNVQGSTLALNCIVEKRTKLLLLKMAQAENCSVASLVNKLVITKAKRVGYINKEELTVEFYQDLKPR
jgi:hypothetical protein